MCEEFKRKLSDMEEFDEKTIANKPWAQKLLDNSLQITRKAVLNWCNIIVKIGETELDIDGYVSIFIHQIENLYEELIADVDNLHEKSLDKITKLLEQLQDLCRDLHVEMPTFSYENVSLCDLYKVIQQRVKEYDSLAEIRRKELRELQQKQMKLCRSLGREIKLVEESPLPQPKEVDELKMYVETLENEAMEREEKFFQLKEEILEIVEELGITPSLDFEKEILNLTNSEVRIADNEMEELQTYHDRLVKQLGNAKEEIAELRSKVDDLWDKLETDIAERDLFRKINTGNSLETLSALKIEVNKLEEIKKANIKVFISKQRQELSNLWERCHCSGEEKNEFAFYYSECYNEDLFELHDREIQKWKSYYLENEEMFALLEEYETLWKKHRELELNSLNSEGANRYKNRGGQLLMEEKLRNKFKKRIPKIEDTLLKLSEAYFVHKGKHFRTFGRTIREHIDKLHQDEDKEFKLKLSAKKQQREQASTVGRSRMNLFPPCASTVNPTHTPRLCPKRKIAATPVTEPVKKLKKGSQAKVSKTGMPKVNVSITRRRSARREKLRQRLSFQSSRNSNKENHNGTVSTSYNDFEKEVTSKDNCRSTTFDLKEQQVMPGISYLQKTPRAAR